MNYVARSYAILEIPSTASPELTKQAYRKLVKIWHPDRYVNDPILKAQAEEKIKKINQAYAVIKNDREKNGSNINKETTNTYDSYRKSSTKVAKTQHTLEFYYQQGMSYLESEDYDAALNSLAQVIRLDPNRLEAYQCRGFILSKLGYDLRAEAEFKKARQIKLNREFNTSGDRDNKTKDYGNTNPSEPSLKLWRTISSFELPIQHLAVTYNRQIAVANGKAEIELWQLDTGKKIALLKGHTKKVTCLAISPNGRTLISGSLDKTIRFWNLETKKIIRTYGGCFDGHLSEITTLVLSGNEQSLISYDADNLLKIWNVSGAVATYSISASQVTSLAISPDCQSFCSGSLEPQLQIRNITIGRIIRSLDSNSVVSSLAFSPDGNLLAAGDINGKIGIWDITVGKEIYSLVEHSARISKVIFGRDGKTLISSSWDGTIKLWKLTTGQEISSIDAHSDKIHNVSISPDYRVLASSSEDKTVKLWRCNL